jgi:hypothetical protein
MRSVRLLRSLLVLAFWSLSIPVWGQASNPPLSPTQGAANAVEEGLRPTSASGTDLNYTPPATLLPEVSDHAESPPPRHLLQLLTLDYTWLPGAPPNGLQIGDEELNAVVEVPLVDGWAPLRICPGMAVHFWDGPGLPSRLYDAYVEIGWRPRLAEWLFTDLAVTPGVYSDFTDFRSEKLQMRGRGLAIVAFSPQLQLAAGALYVNRNKTKVLPAGGVIWNPNDDTKLNFVFPQPKLAHRLATSRNIEWWGYLSGEFGGGRWSVEQTDDSVMFLDYSDVRVILGAEWIYRHGLKGQLEAGFVFDRRVNFTSDIPDFKPGNTLMLRAGFDF